MAAKFPELSAASLEFLAAHRGAAGCSVASFDAWGDEVRRSRRAGARRATLALTLTAQADTLAADCPAAVQTALAHSMDDDDVAAGRDLAAAVAAACADLEADAPEVAHTLMSVPGLVDGSFGFQGWRGAAAARGSADDDDADDADGRSGQRPVRGQRKAGQFERPRRKQKRKSARRERASSFGSREPWLAGRRRAAHGARRSQIRWIPRAPHRCPSKISVARSSAPPWRTSSHAQSARSPFRCAV